MKTRSPALPFAPASDAFRALQLLWYATLGEVLSYEQAVAYGPKVLALVAAAARWQRGRARR